MFLLAVPQAPEKIYEKNDLRGDGYDRGGGDEASCGVRSLAARRGHAAKARAIEQSQPMHGHEDAIDAGEGEPEMDLAKRFVQGPAKQLWKPKKQGGEDGERRSHPHH